MTPRRPLAIGSATTSVVSQGPGTCEMANQIRPLARLFRGMADLIDHDHTSHIRYEAIAKAAGVVAARATAEELVAGRLWQVDGADLLASAYAFHAGLPRQAATAAHVRAMQQRGPASAGAQRQPPVAAPTPLGRPGMGNPEGGTAPPASPASSIASPVDPGRLPGTRLGDLDPADAAKLWTLLSDLRGGQVIPRGQLIWLTGWLPADLAARLLRLLDGGPELVGAQAARIRNAVDRNDPTTPVLAVIVLGWLEAAEQVLAAGGTAQELQVLLTVADRHGQPP
jgi:hypothetical protein